MCVPKGIPELPHLLTEALPQRKVLDFSSLGLLIDTYLQSKDAVSP